MNIIILFNKGTTQSLFEIYGPLYLRDSSSRYETDRERKEGPSVLIETQRKSGAFLERSGGMEAVTRSVRNMTFWLPADSLSRVACSILLRSPHIWFHLWEIQCSSSENSCSLRSKSMEQDLQAKWSNWTATRTPCECSDIQEGGWTWRPVTDSDMQTVAFRRPETESDKAEVKRSKEFRY